MTILNRTSFGGPQSVGGSVLVSQPLSRFCMAHLVCAEIQKLLEYPEVSGQAGVCLACSMHSLWNPLLDKIHLSLRDLGEALMSSAYADDLFVVIRSQGSKDTLRKIIRDFNMASLLEVEVTALKNVREAGFQFQTTLPRALRGRVGMLTQQNLPFLRSCLVRRGLNCLSPFTSHTVSQTVIPQDKQIDFITKLC